MRAGRESDGVRTREARFRFKNWWVRLRSWGRGVTGVAGCGGGLLVSATAAMTVTVSGLVGYMYSMQIQCKCAKLVVTGRGGCGDVGRTGGDGDLEKCRIGHRFQKREIDRNALRWSSGYDSRFPSGRAGFDSRSKQFLLFWSQLKKARQVVVKVEFSRVFRDKF